MAKKQKKAPRDYDHKTLHEERSYGFFWYDWIWTVVRPLIVFTASLAIVCGLVLTGWNFVTDRFIGPVSADDETSRSRRAARCRASRASWRRRA